MKQPRKAIAMAASPGPLFGWESPVQRSLGAQRVFSESTCFLRQKYIYIQIANTPASYIIYKRFLGNQIWFVKTGDRIAWDRTNQSDICWSLDKLIKMQNSVLPGYITIISVLLFTEVELRSLSVYTVELYTLYHVLVVVLLVPMDNGCPNNCWDFNGIWHS
jgi:hypothetical protein